jgi:hypothetical protein
MLYLSIVALAGVTIYLAIRFVRMKRKVGGMRRIVCPETKMQAMVEVDVGRAALTSLIGQEEIRLENCSRWPSNEDCGQECLLQLEVAPPECLVRSVLLKWYRGKKCVFCHCTFESIALTDHKPAVLKLDGPTVEWSDIALADAEQVMQTLRPVCWNCHIAQTFWREHPDLAVIRPRYEIAFDSQAITNASRRLHH